MLEEGRRVSRIKLDLDKVPLQTEALFRFYILRKVQDGQPMHTLRLHAQSKELPFNYPKLTADRPEDYRFLFRQFDSDKIVSHSFTCNLHQCKS